MLKPEAADAVLLGRYGMVGLSSPMQKVYHQIEKVAPRNEAVLIRGESGTGKELAARAIYESSARSNGGYVHINCAGFARELLPTELFGHERGAFTGAVRGHVGKFEKANHGTLFLDEIGDMPPELQAMVLRAIEYGTVTPVGSNRTIDVDVRLIAATNKNLEQEIREGRFREDLYHRINVFPINLPPLRERSGDIPSLVEYFVSQYQTRNGGHNVKIEPKAIDFLMSYGWPGNVRELQNVLKRALILYGEDRGTLTMHEFQTLLGNGQNMPSPADSVSGSLEEAIRTGTIGDIRKLVVSRRVRELGEEAPLQKIASSLGLDRRTLYKYLGESGLEVVSFRVRKKK